MLRVASNSHGDGRVCARVAAGRARGRVVYLAGCAAEEDLGVGEAHEVEIVRWWEELDRSGAKRDAADVPAGAGALRAGRDGRDRRGAAGSVRALGGGCAGVDQAAERGRRAAGLGGGQLRRLDSDGPVRDRDPDADRRAGAGADQENWASAGIGSGRARRPHLRRNAERATGATEQARLDRDEPRRSRRKRSAGAPWVPRRSSSPASSSARSVYPASGNTHWSSPGLDETAAKSGLSRAGPQRHDRQGDAHEADRDPSRVRRRSRTNPASTTPRRLLARNPMLGGLLRCAGCGHTLKITGNTTSRRAALPDLLLHRAATPRELCPARATIAGEQARSPGSSRSSRRAHHETGGDRRRHKATTEIEKLAGK